MAMPMGVGLAGLIIRAVLMLVVGIVDVAVCMLQASPAEPNRGGKVSGFWQAELPALFVGRQQCGLDFYVDLIVNKKPKSSHIEGTS
jgi:hypothetical protein